MDTHINILYSLIWENRQKKISHNPIQPLPFRKYKHHLPKKIKKNQKETLESETKVGNFSL